MYEYVFSYYCHYDYHYYYHYYHMGHSRCCGTEAKVQDLPCIYIYICISLYTNTLSLHSHAMSCFDRQRLSLNVSGVAGAGAGDVAQFLGGTQGPCHSLLAQSLGPWGCGLDILGPLGLGRPRIYWEYNGFPLVGGVSRGGFLWRNMR